MNKLTYNKKQGITLIVLVVTIVIILILVGTIAFGYLRTNPTKKAQETKLRNDILAMLEQRESIIQDYKFNSLGNKEITEEDLKDVVPNEYKDKFIATEDGLEYIGDDEEEKEIAIDMGCIDGSKDRYPIIDRIETSTGTDRINISTIIKDDSTPIKEYEYSISEDGKTWTDVTITDDGYISIGHKDDTTYYVKVTVTDEDGKTDTSDIIEVATKPVIAPELIYSNDEYIKGPGTVTAIYEKQENITNEYKVENTWTKTGDGEQQITVNKNGEVVAKAEDPSGNTAETKIDVTNIDILPPLPFEITTNADLTSVTITASTTDATGENSATSGMKGYQFSNDGGKTWTPIQSSGNYTYTGLNQNTSYEFVVKAVDNVGNERLSGKNDTTGNVGGGNETGGTDDPDNINGDISFKLTPDTWTNQGVKVEIIYDMDSNVTKQYSFDNSTWHNYTAPVTVTDNNTIVYARGVVGSNVGKTAQIKVEIIDRLAPLDFEPRYRISSSSISIFVDGAKDADATAVDGKSDIRGFKYSIDDGKTWTDEKKSNVYTISGLKMNTTYNIKIQIIDNAGNVKTSSTKTVTTENLELPVVTHTPTEWTNGNVNCTIVYKDGTDIINEYKFVPEGTDPSSVNYSLYKQPFVIEENGKVYARVRDISGQVVETIHDVTNIDKVNPNVVAYTGIMMYKDLNFASGLNGLEVYNNSNNGNVIITRKAMETPTGSGYGIEVKTLGTASPGLGGVYFGTESLPNKVYVTRILAKFPKGYKINLGTNQIGDGYSYRWLTSQQGTGEFEEYICEVKCGSSGTFETTNFFYLDDGSAPVTWEIASATVFDANHGNAILLYGTDNLSGVKYYGETTSSTAEPTYKEVNPADCTTAQIITGLTQTGTHYVWVKDSATNKNKTSVVTNDLTDGYILTINPNGGRWNNTTSNSTRTQDYNTTIDLGKATPPAGYKVTFNGNGGSTPAAINTTKSFTNWTLSGNGILDGTVYRFRAGSGTVTANYKNDAITLPTPTRTGYEFLGWYTAASGGTKVGNGGASYTATGNITLYAQWKALTYTVKYNGNGATSGSTASSTHYIDVAKNLNWNGFSRTGYNFKGWSRSSGGGVEFTNGQSVINLTTVGGSTVNLYAVWRDEKAPTAPGLSIVSGTLGDSGWYRSNIGVRVTQGTDDGSGVNRVVYSLSGAMSRGETTIANNGVVTITADGATTITAYTYDNAGNKSSARTLTVYKDTTPPSYSNVSWTNSSTMNNWTNTDRRTITFNASDNASGIYQSGGKMYIEWRYTKTDDVNNIYNSFAAFDMTFNGTTASDYFGSEGKKLFIRFRDVAGNWTGWMNGGFNWHIDKTAPCTPYLRDANNYGEWYDGATGFDNKYATTDQVCYYKNVDLKWSFNTNANDNLSGESYNEYKYRDYKNGYLDDWETNEPESYPNYEEWLTPDDFEGYGEGFFPSVHNIACRFEIRAFDKAGNVSPILTLQMTYA